jgi:hypothetical protein
MKTESGLWLIEFFVFLFATNGTNKARVVFINVHSCNSLLFYLFTAHVFLFVLISAISGNRNLHSEFKKHDL